MTTYAAGHRAPSECARDDEVVSAHDIEITLASAHDSGVIFTSARQTEDNVSFALTNANANFDSANDSSSRIRQRWHLLRAKCLPHGLVYESIPLALTLSAMVLTASASWACNFFTGANIGFIGTTYGLWTVEDMSGNCQLWDALFFSYNLDDALVAARALSMSAMVLGLAILTTITFASQCHVVSWCISVMFVILLILSLAFSHIYNLWITFFLFSYVIIVLIVSALFIHPFHRRISPRGCVYVATCMILCMAFTILTLVVLSSRYCTCKTLTDGDLENRVKGNPCSSTCQLHIGGYLMILSSFLWLLAAVAALKIGIQHQEIHLESPNDGHDLYGGYVSKSITTRMKTTMGMSSSDDSEAPPRRKLLQKICCDFRVVDRSRRECCLFWLFRTMLAILVVIYFFILIVFIGSRIENDRAALAPDTTPNFILDPVCAFNESDTAKAFQTFATVDDAHNANMTIAHCGPCARCSNINDIETYVTTRETAAKSAKQCGRVAVLGSYEVLVDCLEEKINFSRECTMCWADNMKSTASNCMFTCMKTLFTGFMASNNVESAGNNGWLNQCLLCDEKMSGTGFVKCSGVARRRLGIRSEIERDQEEQCVSADVNWVTYSFADS